MVLCIFERLVNSDWLNFGISILGKMSFLWTSSTDDAPQFMEKNTKHVKNWSVDEVGRWLDETGNTGLKSSRFLCNI
jgi:hypothetical protein